MKYSHVAISEPGRTSIIEHTWNRIVGHFAINHLLGLILERFLRMMRWLWTIDRNGKSPSRNKRVDQKSPRSNDCEQWPIGKVIWPQVSFAEESHNHYQTERRFELENTYKLLDGWARKCSAGKRIFPGQNSPFLIFLKPFLSVSFHSRKPVGTYGSACIHRQDYGLGSTYTSRQARIHNQFIVMQLKQAKMVDTFSF